MERLRRWYLNFRGRGDELGPDKLMGVVLLVAFVLYVLAGGAPDNGWGWAE